jgi:exoribonuclease R
VPNVPLRIAVDDPAIVEGLARIRAEQKVPEAHAPEVVAEAEAAAKRVLGSLDTDGRRDARAIELVTIDPAGSRDLDQALHIEARGAGWRVHYAIADLAAFVEPGGPLDLACWDRGLTFYLPDHRSPLHPPAIGEGAGSLLPGEDRPSVLWTIDLDADGSVEAATVERAVVRSRAQLDYDEVQRTVDGGGAAVPETLRLLQLVGEARQRQEVARGGVSLDLPAQRVEPSDGGYRIEFETTLPSMGWNAQISLLAGIVAGERMAAAGIGLLRTLPPAQPWVLDRVKRAAHALHVDWPDGASYAEVVRNLDSRIPDEAALLALAARGLRGAGYLALPRAVPAAVDDPSTAKDDERPTIERMPKTSAVAASPEVTASARSQTMEHAAVASVYAHVTAPLRRLGDRYAAEVCLALGAGETPPGWVTERLTDLPAALQRASGRESGASRAAVDLAEALVLRAMIGDELAVAVVSVDDDGSIVVCREPAVETRIAGRRLPLGDEISVEVVAADPVERKVDLRPV